jgi:hypothetical protein
VGELVGEGLWPRNWLVPFLMGEPNHIGGTTE